MIIEVLPSSEGSHLSALYPWIHRCLVSIFILFSRVFILKQARSEMSFLIYCGPVPLMKLFEWVRDSVWGMSHPGTACSLQDNLREEGAGNICKDTGEKVTAGRPGYLSTDGKTGRQTLSSADWQFLSRYIDDYIWVIPRTIAVVNKTRFANSLSANAFRKCTAGNKERSPCLVIHSHFCGVWRPFFYPVQLRDIFLVSVCQCCFWTTTLVSFWNNRKIDLSVML